MTERFFELIQISIGRKEKFDENPSDKEWAVLFDMAEKQSMAGILFEGMKKALPNAQDEKPITFYEWLGIVQQTEIISEHHLKNTKKLYEWFKKQGFDSCILKGVGTAQLYPEPKVRQSGDIDIWVSRHTINTDISTLRDQVIGMMRANGVDVSVVDYVNCHAGFFDDIDVEVHFRPTYMFNPFRDRKVQRWLGENRQLQMEHFDNSVGFAYPTIVFNLVFSLIHIYRHVFSEGIGLRQLTDYYYILIHSTENERQAAFDTLRTFGLKKFVATVMYVMRRVFDIEETLLLCQPNQKEGEYLLAEILLGGNFGQYDDRNKHLSSESRMMRGFESIKRNLRFLKHYPSEVMWSPAWKTWHWCWRKWKGYL